MTNGMERTWPADAFDAVNIRTGGGQIIVRGTNDDDFKLETENSKNQHNALTINQSGRWLQLSTRARNGDLKLTLHFPRKKIWLIDFVTRQASFRAEDVNAWLHLMLGKGDVEVENCRGALTVISGRVDIKTNNFIETEVPERPPQPDEVVSETKVTSAKFPDWGKDDWANWGLDVGEKVLRKIFDTSENAGQKPGISLKVARGDLDLQDMEARYCVIRSAKGNVTINGGRISGLDINIAKGDIEVDSCIPAGGWNIRSNHGNVNISVTPEVTARLNASTRVGNINSSVPLVKVTRQGPGAWHGGRMVGTIGVVADAADKVPEIRLSALHGDINIRVGSAPGQYPVKPPAPKAPQPPRQPAWKKVISYKTPAEVLEALSEGKISVEEAESVLDDLGYWKKTT